MRAEYIFNSLLHKMEELSQFKNKTRNFFLGVNPQMIGPLLVELFDLEQRDEEDVYYDDGHSMFSEI